MQVTLYLRTVNELNGCREHWAVVAKRRKLHRKTAFLQCPVHPIPCTVTMTRYSAGRLDDDNLRAALKSVRDGIADRLGINDGGADVVWVYKQGAAARGHHYVVVEIYEGVA